MAPNHAAAGKPNETKSSFRCIFTKKEESSSHGRADFRNSCGCHEIIFRIKGGDAYLDLLDAWHDVISPMDGGVATSNRHRPLQSSDPNRRLFNRRSRLSSVDLDSSDSPSPPTNSPPGSKSSWVEAPEFFPSSPPIASTFDVMMPSYPVTPPGLNGFQNFDQFLASGFTRMQRQHQSGNQSCRQHTPQHRFGGWRDLPPAPRGSGRNYNSKKTHHTAALASAAEVSPTGGNLNNHLHRKSCSYCIRNGGDKSMYDSHCLRNPITNAIMCPELKKLQLCHKCGDTGDDYVHASHEHDRF